MNRRRPSSRRGSIPDSRRSDFYEVLQVQVKISARHGHLAPESQAEIRERTEKLLHFFDRITFIEVTVDCGDESKPEVEVIATVEHKQEFVSRDSGPELLTVLTRVLDKVKQQVKHYKERVQDHRRDPSHNNPSTNGNKPQ